MTTTKYPRYDADPDHRRDLRDALIVAMVQGVVTGSTVESLQVSLPRILLAAGHIAELAYPGPA